MLNQVKIDRLEMLAEQNKYFYFINDAKNLQSLYLGLQSRVDAIVYENVLRDYVDLHGKRKDFSEIVALGLDNPLTFNIAVRLKEPYRKIGDDGSVALVSFIIRDIGTNTITFRVELESYLNTRKNFVETVIPTREVFSDSGEVHLDAIMSNYIEDSFFKPMIAFLQQAMDDLNEY